MWLSWAPKAGRIFQEAEVFFMPIIMRASGNDTTDSLIRKFQKKIVAEKVIQEYRDLDFFKKKSEIRQEKRKEKRRKIMRAQRLASAY